MKDRNQEHSDNWKTPDLLYNELNDQFNFNFDPCPLTTEPITEETDGLLKDWGKFKLHKSTLQ